MNAGDWVLVIGTAVFMLVLGMGIGMEIEHKQSACQHTKLRTYCVDCHKEITNE